MLLASSLIHAAEQAPSNPPTGSVLIYIFGALLAGGLVPVAYQVVQRWRRGPLEDSQIIGETVRNELGGMKELLSEYRIELEVTKRQIEDYRKDLGDVTRQLAKAQVQIANLERDLDRARGRREDMEHELETLRRHYDELLKERAHLQEEVTRLEDRFAQLGAITGGGAGAGSGGADISP